MSLTHKNAFSYDELISCAKGELFGQRKSATASAAYADDRQDHKITETGGNFDKGFIEAELRYSSGFMVLPLSF